ncbi:S8 family serine peptidase [Alkalihalophilus lindianensis]|uniref:S8 family serine peptidase n=1 Tax=Alkalihalophilus lindianensis TaxID=1630542 RepID=A0ABU3XD37_9BACI|nr:S8 family serine peptidase [Alkalihalophilus lindianensis]MDV2685801.1 S8 family serine peptidase [Alkalihalophilus lindianensis]
MKRTFQTFVIYTMVLALALTSFGTASFANNQRDLSLAEVMGEIDTKSSAPTTVIVELEEESIVEAKQKGKNQSKQNLKAKRDQVKNNVLKETSSSKIGQEYEYIFSGFAVELKGNEIPNLLTIPGVKAIYPDVEYTTTTVDEGFMIEEDAYSPSMLDSAPFIGSDDAWDAGFTGEGVTVAVIDTGVDYTHPDLAHAFGDYKGWDFVDNNNDPQETPPNDPRGRQTNHGTHVAGTVAANGLIKGVAPDATLLGYRVLGPGGSGTTENVVAGIERAVQDGADVMNLSLGNTLNSPDWATSIALDWAMAEGVVAVTSNGNSGPNNWTVGSPGTSREAISVGATRLPYEVYSADISTDSDKTYESAQVMGFSTTEELLALDGEEFEFVYAGLGAASDFEGKDLTGKIALMIRGEYAFVDKAANAKAAGAVGAIIFNNVEGVQPEVPGMAVPTIMLTNADGEALKADLEAGYNTVSFSIEFDKMVDETVADFSSRGPVMDTWMIKPDVSAPGVNITSTVPTHQADNPHGYAALQGTSMAAPHVAGAAALILEANPNWDVDAVKASLMNTAENLYDANGDRYPHNTQGAGSIRVLDAIETQTLVTPGSHSFGVFNKTKGKQTERQHFTLNNLSSERKSYSFDVQFDKGVEGIKVNTSNNLRVQPGKSQKVNFNVQVDASKLAPGYYPGTIIISEGSNSFEVPTILFVQEPDYPRITSLGYNLNPATGDLVGSAYVPGGAEELEFEVYNENLTAFIGHAFTDTNIGAGYYDFTWDLTIDGGTLAPGNYRLVAWSTKAGKTNYSFGDVFTVQ